MFISQYSFTGVSYLLNTNPFLSVSDGNNKQDAAYMWFMVEKSYLKLIPHKLQGTI